MNLFVSLLLICASATLGWAQENCYWTDCKKGGCDVCQEEFEIGKVVSCKLFRNKEHCCRKQDDHPSWMNELITSGYGDIPFNHLLRPGTHNSGYDEEKSCPLPIPDKFGRCQKLTLTEQLDLGIRGFDIRAECVDRSHPKLEFWHGPCDDGNFGQGMYDMRQWLRSHTTEVITLRLRNNKDSNPSYYTECRSLMNDLLKQFDDIAWMGSVHSFPTLAEMFDGGFQVLMINHENHNGGVTTWPTTVMGQGGLDLYHWEDTAEEFPYFQILRAIQFINGWGTSMNAKLSDVHAYSTGSTSELLSLVSEPKEDAYTSNGRMDQVVGALEKARDRGVFGSELVMDYAGYFSDRDIVQDIINYNRGLPKDTNGLRTFHGLYQGCYRDETRFMGHWEGRIFGLKSCLKHCFSQGYDYAGLQYYSYCFCSRSTPPSSLKTSEGDCNYACTSGRGTICGGLSRMSVYERSYRGCYQDFAFRIFGPLVPGHYGIKGCIDKCSSQGFIYAGLQWYDQCYCSNKPPPGHARPDGECNTICHQGAGMCGGGYRMSVYKLKNHECAASRCGKNVADAGSKCGSNCWWRKAWGQDCPSGESCFPNLDTSLDCCTTAIGNLEDQPYDNVPVIVGPVKLTLDEDQPDDDVPVIVGPVKLTLDDD